MKRLCLSALGALALACSSGGVSTSDDAKQAYLGLDPSIEKAIALGFQGFNSATSANIAPQSASGNAAGTISISGQVDQGKSANKTMRLTEQLSGYSDDGQVSYATSAATLDIMLSSVPTGTMSGTLSGTYTMSGALTGTVTLSLSLSSALEPGAGAQVARTPGTTRVTGSATSGSGTFTIDITR